MELHPDLPPEGVSRVELLGEDYLRTADESLRWLAADAGLEMTPPSVVANTHLALEAAEFARQQGGFESLHRRLFEAYYQDGMNIGDPEVLVELVKQAGLDGDELRKALAERRYQRQLDEVREESWRLGITGVPTFFVSGQRVVGAQPYEVLRQAALSAGANPRPS